MSDAEIGRLGRIQANLSRCWIEIDGGVHEDHVFELLAVIHRDNGCLPRTDLGVGECHALGWFAQEEASESRLTVCEVLESDVAAVAETQFLYRE